MRRIILTLLFALLAPLPLFAATIQVAPFECDVTLPLGQPIYSSFKPLAEIEHPLLAKGVVLDDGKTRCVLCSVDYCELCNGAFDAFRNEIAKAAGVDPKFVAVHAVHQHTAPITSLGELLLLQKAPNPPKMLDPKVVTDSAAKVGRAVKKACESFVECDKVGLGKAKVDRVASIRRLKSKDGKSITRWSSCTDPKLIAMPEGPIDPFIKTITFAKGDKPIVRLHYYATHPQSFYGDPRASYDVPGIAREATEKKDGAMQIYFNGCAGNVTMGKYNNRTKEARTELAKRLAEGMDSAIAATKWQAADKIDWNVAQWKMVPRTDGSFPREKALAILNNASAKPSDRWGAALDIDFLDRINRPVDITAMKIGKIVVLNLPGESFIEYQHYAQGLLPDDFVAVAAYGDCAPGYICTEVAFSEGGYEPTASRVVPESEKAFKTAIREALGAK